MYRVFTEIVVTQITQVEGLPTRNKVIKFDFMTEISAASSWRDFTNGGEITVPKSVYVRDAYNKLVPIDSKTNAGGFSSAPLFMRGDKVVVNWGYRYFKNSVEIFEGSKATNQNLFEGWITEVAPQKPMKFKIEDNFWKLKQIPCPTIVFSKSTTLEQMLTTLLKASEFTVNVTTNTTFGNVRVGNVTVAEFLEMLRKNYHFESYFRGNELRCGSQVYFENEAKNFTFQFQKNIIENSLVYNRKDDISLSVVAYNQIEEETDELTKDGQPKTKKKRLECLVTLQYGSDVPKVYVKEKGKDYPPNLGGERMTLPYPGAKTISELSTLAANELRKYYYNGFRGKFTTFGIPFVKFGDNVKIVDPILPERNGRYKVRAVEYKGGINGLRQIIELDYKIPD